MPPGKFSVKEVQLVEGETVTLTNKIEFKANQTVDKIYVDYKDVGLLSPGGSVLLDDGLIALRVIRQNEDGDVSCLILNSGMLGNRKGVNLPGANITLPPLSKRDEETLRLGLKYDIDFVAASFVSRASDVSYIRDFIAKEMAAQGLTGAPPQIISKIENGAALENFDEILRDSDGIMVARGDLGVEIPFRKVNLVPFNPT